MGQDSFDFHALNFSTVLVGKYGGFPHKPRLFIIHNNIKVNLRIVTIHCQEMWSEVKEILSKCFGFILTVKRALNAHYGRSTSKDTKTNRNIQTDSMTVRLSESSRGAMFKKNASLSARFACNFVISVHFCLVSKIAEPLE